MTYKQSILFIIVSSIGGFLLSWTGLSIGWMIGTIIMAAFLSFRQPAFLKLGKNINGLPPFWFNIGQLLLAIELGKKINLSVLQVFHDNWMTITIMLLLSVFFSLLSGLILWKFSKTDLLTSFFATAPGGIATMPGIADEVGANTAVVSIIQTMRVFLVVMTIPIIASTWLVSSLNQSVVQKIPETIGNSPFIISSLLGTLLLVFAALAGYKVGTWLKIPAPWLVGGMIGVAVVQSVFSVANGYDVVSWWPHSLLIIAQLLIATSVGSRMKKSMFIGLKKTVAVAFFSTLGLILAMFICAYIVSKLTGITLITSVLAFAPGGVAEMATTSVVLHADSTFVVAVQVLRIVAVILLLPPLFRLLHQHEANKQTKSEISV